MVDHAESSGPPSLLSITVRRSIVTGRLYLIIGTGVPLFFAIVLALAAGQAFAAVLPLLLPIFAVQGALGGLMVFTNDRLKGVYEYLVAYGVSPRQLFLNVLIASMVLVSIVLGVTLTAGFAVYLAAGNPLTLGLLAALLLYGIPMSYAAVGFAGTVGMFWTSLSSPREGINSPVGLVPIVGVAPPVLTLVIAQADPQLGTIVALGAVALIAVVVLVLIALASRFMPRERLLSPA